MRARSTQQQRATRFSAPSVRAPYNSNSAADVHLDRTRRESIGAALSYIPGMVKSLATDAYVEDEIDPDYEFPLWWFFLAVPSQAFGPWIVGSTLWGVVVPTAIGETFGDDDKAFVLATLGTLGTIMGFAAPFSGSLSDRLPEIFPRCTKWFGRRRPFFLVGQTIGVTAIYYTWVALEEKRTVLLFVSWGISNLSWQFTGPPYNTIFQETIPESQRGLAVTINGWLCQVCQARFQHGAAPCGLGLWR